MINQRSRVSYRIFVDTYHVIIVLITNNKKIKKHNMHTVALTSYTVMYL
eukprot:UN04468